MKPFKVLTTVFVLLFSQMLIITSASASVTATTIYSIDYPIGIAGDSAGNIYIADDHNTDSSKRGLVVVPAATGTIFGTSVTAGVGKVLAAHTTIAGVAVNAAGDVFFSLTDGKIYVYTSTNKTLFGVSVTANTKTLIASGTGLIGPLDFDSAGNLFGVHIATGDLYVLPVSSGTLYGVSVTANTSVRLYSGGSSWFWDLAVDSSGNIFIADGWGLQGVFVLPKTTSTIYGQSFTANTFAKLNSFGTLRYAGIDVDANDVLYANEYGNITHVISATPRTVFGVSLTANTYTDLNDTSGYIDQGLFVTSSGDLIQGGPGGTFKLTASAPAPTGPTAEELAAQAEAARLALLQSNREAALKKINDGLSLTLDEISKLNFGVVSEVSLAAINDEFLTRKQNGLTLGMDDLSFVIYKSETIEKISNSVRRISSRDLVSIGLITAEDKRKSSILRAIESLSSGKKDSFSELLAVVQSIHAYYNERSLRLAKAIAGSRAS
jgi:hypothetical protein